ncbi:MAG: hypothetical protein N2507_02655 [Candidatus Bipolaricaulota bacterium]|nr:hypothetical protein [Candidatus Bipolaricaulota bacterium]MCX7844248.1 hypothetical protein [Candidatus Bipolaricaulota bacterium]MDW8151868.1 hypothetical protein [Candidatus Bipolaricaulota bacterium]
MRSTLVGALLVGLLFGVVALGKVEAVIPQVGYEVLPGAPGYVLLVIPNAYGVSLNKFGISLAVEGTVTGALALQGTGPAVIEGGPLYWVVSLPGAGLAPKGILLVSVKVPAGTDIKAVVAKIVGYKVS